MPLLNKLRQYLRSTRRKESEPAAAYDIWALSYDHQPDNLMLALDETLCGEWLAGIHLSGKVIADIGCGTGRHWKKIMDRDPARLVGYDVSGGMLEILRKKFPAAETRQLTDHLLPGLENASCDLLLSTLTMAHIPNPEAALTEWFRVVRPGGEMIITDYHPIALARGGQRTFREGEKVIAVRNHVYPISRILAAAHRLGLHQVNIVEKKIDDTMRLYYEKQNALAVFERFNGVPIIYGLHLKKRDAT